MANKRKPRGTSERVTQFPRASGSEWPLRDVIVDCTGRERLFEIENAELPIGFSLTATELGRGGDGYEFRAFDPASPYAALYRLRRKMHRELATRYLGPDRFPSHDVIRGRITTDESQDHQALLIVDGERFTMDELDAALASHGGFGFELRFLDVLDPAGERSS